MSYHGWCHVKVMLVNMYVVYLSGFFLAQQKSEKGKESSNAKVHHHTLGQKSYSRWRPEWEKEKRLPTPSESSTAESSVVSERVQSRAMEWCLAHQSRTKAGQWGVDPNKVETTRVVNQVVSDFILFRKQYEFYLYKLYL